MRTENRKPKTDNRQPRTENRELTTENRLGFQFSAFGFRLSVLGSLLSVLCFFFSCTKTYRTSVPTSPKIYKETFAAAPNDIYYALRWALKTYGYPIVEEDLQKGVVKTRYVPVKATSHYVDVFSHKDFGANGAYHQLEIKLTPQGVKTEVDIGSRIQAIVTPIKSTGQEEQIILQKVGDYLRDANAKVTNQGVQE